MEKAKKVYVSKDNDQIRQPKQQNETDAGYDVYSAGQYIVNPQKTVLISTGISMAIPTNHMLMVVPRSGLSLRTPLRVANSPGIVDAGYRDEIGIIIRNTSVYRPYTREEAPLYSIDKNSDEPPFGNNRAGKYLIPEGTRIAQLILVKFESMEFIETDTVKNIGSDRGGGFNSTGIK